MVTLLAIAAVAFLASGMLIGSVLTLHIVGLEWDASSSRKSSNRPIVK